MTYFFPGSSNVHLSPSHEALSIVFTLSIAFVQEPGIFRTAFSSGAGSLEQSNVSHGFFAADFSDAAGLSAVTGAFGQSFPVQVSAIKGVAVSAQKAARAGRIANRFIVFSRSRCAAPFCQPAVAAVCDGHHKMLL